MSALAASCRSCGATGLLTVLSLGKTPLANALLEPDQLLDPEPTFPLDLVFCPACSLVQLEQSVPPDRLFRNYVYFSSFSDTMVAHAKALAERLIAQRRLTASSLVIEAASNDGYLLQHYHKGGIPVLGIEPAANVADVATRTRGIRTLVEFFGPPLAERLARDGLRADLFHAHNVLAHVPDPNGFLRGIHSLLKPDGLAVIEVPYVKCLVDQREFDTIYHEHLCYFSLSVLDRLLRRHGLVIRDAELLSIHGGSLRLFAGRGDPAEPPNGKVSESLAAERAQGLDRYDYYREFGAAVAGMKARLCEFLCNLKATGRRLAAYGASAKGSTLLNYFGIGPDLLDFVADRSTVKQGRYMPGTRLPIVAPAALVREMPDYTLLLTWNFAPEILRQQAAYRARGGRFIIPVPELQVV